MYRLMKTNIYKFKTEFDMKTKFRLPKKVRYFLYTLLAVVIVSCKHKRNEDIVMDKDGNYYELRRVGCGNESYTLDLIDTTKYKVVGFNNR